MKKIVAGLGTVTLIAASLVLAQPASADPAYVGEPVVTGACYQTTPMVSENVFLRLMASWNGNTATNVAEREGPTAVRTVADCPFLAEFSWVPTQPGTYTFSVCRGSRILSEAWTTCQALSGATVIVANRPAATPTPKPAKTVKCTNKKSGKVKVFEGRKCPSGYSKVKK